MTEEAPGPLSRLNGAIGSFVSLLATVLLLLLAVATFASGIWRLIQNLGSADRIGQAVNLAVNDALLLLIIGELLITVTQKANLVRELLDFLVIGVTTLVRHALQLVLKPESAQSVVLDLTLNAVAILVLVVAFLSVRVVEARLYPPAAKPPIRNEIPE